LTAILFTHTCARPINCLHPKREAIKMTMTAPPTNAMRAPDAGLIDAAHAAGIPVISRLDMIDQTAAQAVPADLGVVGVRWHDGFLIVAWPTIPTPAEVARVQQRVGTPIVPAIAPGIHEALAALAKQTAPNRPRIERILDYALSKRSSDIHLAVGVPPMVRMGADLAVIPDFPPLNLEEMKAMCAYVAGNVLENFDGDYDGGTNYGGSRFRVNIAMQRGTPTIVMRTIPLNVPKFETLGLPPIVQTLSDIPRGLVLVCGPTGSGKSTTLASIIDRINRTTPCHIITIEDPVEFMHPSRRAMVRQREVGHDTESFARGLKSALRQDPDVILVGEMRDLETIQLAATAAETGHLTFATVHASSAKSTVDRVIDVFPAGQQAQIRAQLANTLRAVVCQSRFSRADAPGSSVVVCEVMIVTPAIANMIREGEIHRIDGAIQSGVEKYGMQPFDLGLARAVTAGALNIDTAAASAHNENDFREYLKVAQRELGFR
jgi:twitching motility protein PilT